MFSHPTFLSHTRAQRAESKTLIYGVDRVVIKPSLVNFIYRPFYFLCSKKIISKWRTYLMYMYTICHND